MAKFAWGNDGVANAYFGREKQKRDMGMLQATERFMTDEAIRRDEARAKAGSDAQAANDPHGLKRKIDAANAIVRAYNSGSGEVGAKDYKNAIQYLVSVFEGGGGSGGVGMPTAVATLGGREPFPGYSAKRTAELLKRGYDWDPRKRKLVKVGQR